MVAKLVEQCGVKHRFCFGGPMRALEPKAVSALRSATAVQDLAEFEYYFAARFSVRGATQRVLYFR